MTIGNVGNIEEFDDPDEASSDRFNLMPADKNSSNTNIESHEKNSSV